MRRKFFTLLTLLLCAVSGAWATDYVIDGEQTFSSSACTVSGLTFTFDSSVGSSQTSGNITIDSKKVLKLGKRTWTISLPEKFMVTRLYIEGMSNSISTAASVAVGSNTVAWPVRPSTKDNFAIGADGLGKITTDYAIPASGSISFTIDGNESLLRIVITGYVESTSTTYTAKNEQSTGNKAYLSNEGSTISGSPTVLSFTNYPMTVEGASIQSGNAQYKFTIGTAGDFTGVKFAANTTYEIIPQAGISITGVKAYGSSNSSTATSIISGTGNEIALTARGDKNTPVTMSPLTLQKNASENYFFTIGSAAQAIIALEVTYTIAENINVAVSSAGYATLYYDKKLAIPTGVTAYKAAVKDASTITITPLEGTVIPANTGVILKADAGTYNFMVTDADATAVTGNILTGTTTATTKAALGGTVYTLGQNSSGVVGLRNYTGTDIRAYSAYATSITSAPSFLGFEIDKDGISTGINAVEKAQTIENGVFFDLQGRKVAQPTKGLYIVNGKKVVIK